MNTNATMTTSNINALRTFFTHPIYSQWNFGYTVCSLRLHKEPQVIMAVANWDSEESTVGRTAVMTLDEFRGMAKMLRLVQKSLYNDTLEWDCDEIITPQSLHSAIYTTDGLVISKRDPGKWSTPRVELSMDDDIADPLNPQRTDITLLIYVDDRQKPTLLLPATLIPATVTTLMDVEEMVSDFENLPEGIQEQLLNME